MSDPVKLTRSIFLVAALLISTRVEAQPSTDGWHWSVSGNIFAGINYQHRKGEDIDTFESQNWAMGMGQRPLGRGQLKIDTMFSFEPYTLKDIGSPQVFQTGETYNGVPLVNYQHPHDLFSTLTAAYVQSVGSWTLTTSAAAVGMPALGPPAFMHRPSAIENPQAPLSHHHLDSLHITPGVITVGVSKQGVGIETSWFQGREPDEDRTDIDFGPLDSWSLRGSWTRGPWYAQVSGGHLNEPEPLNPGDMTRFVASIAHTRTGTISTAVMAAFGHNRESHGNSNGFLVESNMSWLDRNHLYSRIELVEKELPHIHQGFAQPPHELSTVGAFTVGYTRDLIAKAFGRIGIGGDTTMYYVPLVLQETYGAPLSFHAFLRFRFGTSQADVEQHHH